MKSKIEAYFKHDRSYHNGVILVQELSPNIAIKRQLNVQPESPYMTGIIHEELRRLAEIPRPQFQDMLQEPVTPIQVPESHPDPESESAQGADADPPKGSETDPVPGADADPAKGADADPPKGPDTDPAKGAEADPAQGADSDTEPEKKDRRKK